MDDTIGRLVGRYGPDPSVWVWGEEHGLNMEWSPIRSSGLINDLLSLKAPSSGDPCTVIATLFTGGDDRPFTSGVGIRFHDTTKTFFRRGGWEVTSRCPQIFLWPGVAQPEHPDFRRSSTIG